MHPRWSGRLPASPDWGDVAVRAHAAYLEYLATAPVAETRRAPTALAVRTGARSNVENGVVASAADDAFVADAVCWFLQTRTPACWLCPEEPDGDLERTPAAAGCVAETSGVDMGAPLATLPEWVPPPPGVEILEVEDERRLDAWFEVATHCGWFDDPDDRRTRRAVFLALGPAVRRFVAIRDARPVGFATRFVAGRTVLLHDVGVVADERRNGIGRALALTAIDSARRESCVDAVLAPSPDGAKLAEALGFETSPTPSNRWFYLPVRERAAASVQAPV